MVFRYLGSCYLGLFFPHDMMLFQINKDTYFRMVLAFAHYLHYTYTTQSGDVNVTLNIINFSIESLRLYRNNKKRNTIDWFPNFKRNTAYIFYWFNCFNKKNIALGFYSNNFMIHLNSMSLLKCNIYSKIRK